MQTQLNVAVAVVGCWFWPIFALAQKVSRQVTRLRRFNRFQANAKAAATAAERTIGSSWSRQLRLGKGSGCNRQQQQTATTMATSTYIWPPLESNPSACLWRGLVGLGQQESVLTLLLLLVAHPRLALLRQTGRPFLLVNFSSP